MMGIGYIELLLILLIGLFLAALVAGIVVAVVWFSRKGRAPGTGDALSILRERYARGEISQEEYQRMRDELRD